jgi:hypothetical protein
MLLFSQCFDHITEQTIQQYFDNNLRARVNILTIPCDGTPRTLDHLRQLAKVRIRDSLDRGGLKLKSFLAINQPAYCVAHLRHMENLAEQGLSGLYFSPTQTKHIAYF